MDKLLSADGGCGVVGPVAAVCGPCGPDRPREVLDITNDEGQGSSGLEATLEVTLGTGPDRVPGLALEQAHAARGRQADHDVREALLALVRVELDPAVRAQHGDAGGRYRDRRDPVERAPVEAGVHQTPVGALGASEDAL
jgi:hypothetical protein